MGRILKYNPGSQPTYTIGLMVVIGIVGVMDIATGEMMSRLFAARGIDIQYGEYWRLITMGFVHSTLMHIGFNLYGLWLLGGMYERLAGGKWMLGVFLISVLASSGMGALVYDIHINMVGASGGVYGLFASVLAFYYTKTGSIQGMFRLQQSRYLLIWLGIGIFMSISMPNVSLVGHMAGFVPGAVLGYFYEHWYTRKVDFYHKASAIAVVAMTVAIATYACYPHGRASLFAVQAMKAYESDQIDEGDALLDKADGGRRKDDGTMMFMDHLRIWRKHYYKKRSNAAEVLLWPKMHTKPIDSASGHYWNFLNPEAFPSEIVDDTPPDVQDAPIEGGNHGDE